jgi:hypothetical protein
VGPCSPISSSLLVFVIANRLDEIQSSLLVSSLHANYVQDVY